MVTAEFDLERIVAQLMDGHGVAPIPAGPDLRRIAEATGIVMLDAQVPAGVALGMLMRASGRQRRALPEVAMDVVPER